MTSRAHCNNGPTNKCVVASCGKVFPPVVLLPLLDLSKIPVDRIKDLGIEDLVDICPYCKRIIIRPVDCGQVITCSNVESCMSIPASHTLTHT